VHDVALEVRAFDRGRYREHVLEHPEQALAHGIGEQIIAHAAVARALEPLLER
jgi:hypothetical protein